MVTLVVNRSTHRISTWLCLVLAVLATGVAAQPFVLCIESSGSVNIEAAFAREACSDCPAPATGDLGGARGAQPAEACPCLDVALDTTAQRTGSQRVGDEWPAPMSAAAPVAFRTAPLALPSLTAFHARTGYAPVGAGATLVGSIVLRI